MSESGLHFGHYKVGCKSDLITHYHAARVSVTLAHAIQLERWSRGLSVMLEKTLGVTLVTKLRAILIMEGDFNATNKIVDDPTCDRTRDCVRATQYGGRTIKHAT